MRIILAQPLVARIQDHGICPDDYQTIADAVYDSLRIIEMDLMVDDCVQLPNGTTLQVTYKVK